MFWTFGNIILLDVCSVVGELEMENLGVIEFVVCSLVFGSSGSCSYGHVSCSDVFLCFKVLIPFCVVGWVD